MWRPVITHQWKYINDHKIVIKPNVQRDPNKIHLFQRPNYVRNQQYQPFMTYVKYEQITRFGVGESKVVQICIISTIKSIDNWKHKFPFLCLKYCQTQICVYDYYTIKIGSNFPWMYFEYSKICYYYVWKGPQYVLYHCNSLLSKYILFLFVLYQFPILV